MWYKRSSSQRMNAALDSTKHSSHRMKGIWGSGMLWLGLESSRKLSYLLIPLQSLTISFKSISVESLHRFLLWMMKSLPRTAGKGSDIPPPPHTHLPAHPPFMEIPGKGEVRPEELKAPRASGQWKIPGMPLHWVEWIPIMPFSFV